MYRNQLHTRSTRHTKNFTKKLVKVICYKCFASFTNDTRAEGPQLTFSKRTCVKCLVSTVLLSTALHEKILTKRHRVKRGRHQPCQRSMTSVTEAASVTRKGRMMSITTNNSIDPSISAAAK